MESFAVFGGAFLMRPVGGIIIGYIGDKQGRKHALEISIFLMAAATTLMGCLPTYKQIGNPAILLLLMVRMLQGLSVGGQLMSSLVFTLEGKPRSRWGVYGSAVMACANIGTFLGGVVAYMLRTTLTEEQLLLWGWRLPFVSGICISFCGIYLKYFCKDDEIIAGHHAPLPTSDMDDSQIHSSTDESPSTLESETDGIQMEESTDHLKSANDNPQSAQHANPLRIAFSAENRRSLLASSMVPLIWSGGFYLCFVWLSIYMTDLVDPPVPGAFGVNSCSLLLLALLFPFAGALSDCVGRGIVMTTGGVLFGLAGPVLIMVIGKMGSNMMIAFGAQSLLGLSLSMWGAPMCAWLVESFEPEARK